MTTFASIPSEHDTTEESHFLELVQKLEGCLETPIVPGELEPWFVALQGAISDLAPVLRHHVGETHRQQCSEITREDSEMHARVRQLKQESHEVLEAFDKLETQASQFSKRASAMEPGELAAKGVLQLFVDEALWLVVRIRKQELAIRTWFLEAFNRERGPGD